MYHERKERVAAREREDEYGEKKIGHKEHHIGAKKSDFARGIEVVYYERVN